MVTSSLIFQFSTIKVIFKDPTGMERRPHKYYGCVNYLEFDKQYFSSVEEFLAGVYF